MEHGYPLVSTIHRDSKTGPAFLCNPAGERVTQCPPLPTRTAIPRLKILKQLSCYSNTHSRRKAAGRTMGLKLGRGRKTIDINLLQGAHTRDPSDNEVTFLSETSSDFPMGTPLKHLNSWDASQIIRR